MRILVTGANGFIGSALAKRLAADGHQVRCLVHRSDDRLRQAGLEIVRGDVTQPGTLAPTVAGTELVFHLAARPTDWGPRRLFFGLNAEGTRYMLEAAIAAGVRRFVLLSSLAVHRFTGHLEADEQTIADQARYAYGASKVAAEGLVREAQRLGRVQTTILRPGVVVHGPEDTTAFVHMAPTFQGGFWAHVRRGRSLLCYSYVDNLVEGMILAATRPEGAGETFILTDDLRLTWREYVQAVFAAFGVPGRTVSVPAPVARVAGWTAEQLFRLARASHPPPITDYRTALVSRDFHFSCAKAKKVLGYRPTVPFQEGIRRTVAWYLGREGAGLLPGS